MGFVETNSSDAKKAKVARSFITKMSKIGIDQTLPQIQIEQYCDSRFAICKAYDSEVERVVEELEKGRIIVLVPEKQALPAKLKDMTTFSEVGMDKEANELIEQKLRIVITKDASYYER